MRVAVISDTHVRKHLSKIENLIEEKLKDVDLIIHAGDFTNSKTLPYIKKHFNVIAVYGNNDKEETRQVLKEKEIITLENYKIGIYHGHGDNKTTLDNVYATFENENLDIIIFGHSHKPFITTRDKTLIINPGSPSSKRKERFYSYIILDLLPSGIEVNLKLFTE